MKFKLRNQNKYQDVSNNVVKHGNNAQHVIFSPHIQFYQTQIFKLKSSQLGSMKTSNTIRFTFFFFSFFAVSRKTMNITKFCE